MDARLCQLQDWVRDNIVKLGTVKTALNVADLNTKKLTFARRAFLLYFLSQVELSSTPKMENLFVLEKVSTKDMNRKRD